MIFYGGTTVTGGGVLRKSMAAAGLQSLAFFGGDGISDDTFLATAGSMANGSYYTVAAPETSRLPGAREFVAEYRKRWGGNVGPYSANAFAATLIEVAAIEKAIQADGGKLPARAEILKNVAATKNFTAPIGKIGFDANGDTTAGILSLYRIENGKAAFIDQVFEGAGSGFLERRVWPHAHGMETAIDEVHVRRDRSRKVGSEVDHGVADVLGRDVVAQRRRGGDSVEDGLEASYLA